MLSELNVPKDLPIEMIESFSERIIDPIREMVITAKKRLEEAGEEDGRGYRRIHILHQGGRRIYEIRKALGSNPEYGLFVEGIQLDETCTEAERSLIPVATGGDPEAISAEKNPRLLNLTLGSIGLLIQELKEGCVVSREEYSRFEDQLGLRVTIGTGS